ncbi:hypothetical protein Goarm_018764 [Gossypium armourianum]|uniref:Uncharacterized protein n=1 Tax=Gossypium armourianum TaxID=34283 RepID=A0A7J9IJF9_9ROSI|nr:hypothetical protein [Gossypium armourianum]
MVSGQRVNFDKSLIYFRVNVDFSVKEEIVNLLGVRLASNPEKFLGLPMMVGRNKKPEDMLVWKYEGSGDYTVKSRMCGLRCKFELLFLNIRWFTKFVLLEHLLKQMTDINDSLLFLYRKLATTAVLARNYKGEVVGAETYLFEDVVDAFVAEARACERALIFASKIFVSRAVNEAAHYLELEGRRRVVCGSWVNGVLIRCKWW